MPSISDQTASLIPPETPYHCFSCAMTVPAASRFHLKSTLSPLPSCGRALLNTPVARNSR